MPRRFQFLDKPWPWLVAAAAIVLLFLFSTMVEVRIGPSDGRPLGSVDEIRGLGERTDLNLLFVVIDTLRADRLGCYGYGRETSPELDRFASEGVRFARHLAPSSWTKASMASLWTGMYPARTGITRFDDVVPDQARLASEILRDAGFRTAGIYRNGWISPTFGFAQGFGVYRLPVPRPRPPSVRVSNPTLTLAGTDEDAVAAALEFLRIHGDERWFLYLHLMDVHQYVYDEESALFGGSYSDIYDNSIRWVDGAIGVLLDRLAEWGYRENTLVAISSDHGEAFRERGFEGHARRVYRESTEVPFLLAFPFRLEPGIVVDVRTRNVDVWPTLLDLIGLPSPPEIDGRSLLPDLLASARGEALPGVDRTAVAHLDRTWGKRGREPLPSVAVADGRFRYVRTAEPSRSVEELFDAGTDPGELEPQAAAAPEVLERLRAVADAYLETVPPWGEAPKREIDELELGQLRALGYAVP
jgi:arylsulfatase A-like enzyme